MSGAYNANGQQTVSSESAIDAIAITTSDSTVYSPPLRGIYVGVTGNINVITPNGTTVLFSNVPAGFILPVYCSRVKATSTTATTLIGLV